MPDQPLTLIVLAQFHRQVILTDVENIARRAVADAERLLGDQIREVQDAVLKRLDELEKRLDR
jgi:hypothetical protein